MTTWSWLGKLAAVSLLLSCCLVPPPGRSSGAGFAIATTGLHLAYSGRPYSAVLTVVGGTPPSSWTVTSGSLPAGLRLNGDSGAIVGSPSQGGDFDVTVTARDSSGAKVSKNFRLSVFERTLDDYGGLADLPCASGRASRFYVEKIGVRWTLCTPAGHPFWMAGVYHVYAGDNTADHEGVALAQIVQTKYARGLTSNPTLNWEVQAVRRLRSWAFNTVGEYSYAGVWPTRIDWGWAGITADTTIPEKLPFVVIVTPGVYALSNANGYAKDAVKDIVYGVKSTVYRSYRGKLPDLLDENLTLWMREQLRHDSVIRNSFTGPNSDYLIGFTVDESDDMWGFGAGPDFPTVVEGAPSPGLEQPHLGWMALVTAPVQTANRFQNAVYRTTLCHTKQALGEWLSKRYGGQISRLNAAWKANYTGFGSAAAPYTAEAIGRGDGSSKVFQYTLAHPPVSPYSVRILVSGKPVSGDDGNSTLGVGGVTGTVAYDRGTLSITFADAPAREASIAVDYQRSGFGFGAGLLDEDGTCPSKRPSDACWVPSDHQRLSGATRAMIADLDGFLLDYADRYFGAIRSVLREETPGSLYLGTLTGGWGAPPRAGILRAMGRHADILQVVQIPPPCRACADAQQRVDFVAAHGGDKPWAQWMGFQAKADSQMSRFAAAGDLLRTQEDRGALYRELLSRFVNASDTSTGTFHTVGFQWWELYDNRAEQANWGLMTRRDHPYDGVSATSRSGVDSWGYPTGCLSPYGCEQRDYGSFLEAVRNANLSAFRAIAGQLQAGALPRSGLCCAGKTTQPTSAGGAAPSGRLPDGPSSPSRPSTPLPARTSTLTPDRNSVRAGQPIGYPRSRSCRCTWLFS